MLNIMYEMELIKALNAITLETEFDTNKLNKPTATGVARKNAPFKGK